MGYETNVPAVPSRSDELQMLTRMEDSWLSQPFYKFYMNENLRRRKMEHGARRNNMWANYIRNFSFYGLLTLPLIAIIPRFFVYSATNVPTFHKYPVPDSDPSSS